MKNHINLNYTASDETYYKYRALSIPKPSINMSGIYTCYVSSYTTEDKKSAHLQIIVPESDIQIKVTTPDIEGNIKVECIVKDIYPAPIVSIMYVKIIIFIILKNILYIIYNIISIYI